MSTWKPKRMPFGRRAKTMAASGVKMMLHDRLKMLGTLFGVVFAVLLTVQQLGTMFGLVYRNTMFVDNSQADIWIVPPATEALQPGKLFGEGALLQARATEGVEAAEPLLFGGGTLTLPSGGNEQVTLIGTRAPNYMGGPWNIIQGNREDLQLADGMFFEDSKREQFGGLNIGSIRELNGKQVRVVGFSWGLIAFAPAYAFAEYDFARTLLNVPDGKMNFVLVRVRKGYDIEKVRAEIAKRVPEGDVVTRQTFSSRITKNLLTGPIGISFATSTSFGLAIGFFIVALLMFSSVLDNIREFGTLKAIGCTNGDLTKLILAQSMIYAFVGSFIGLGLVMNMVENASSAEFFLVVPKWLLVLAPIMMLGMCLSAAFFALWRIRKLEPGMVFR
ncbi:MAG: ABC transporter permease [bacterium]